MFVNVFYNTAALKNFYEGTVTTYKTQQPFITFYNLSGTVISLLIWPLHYYMDILPYCCKCRQCDV